MAIATQDGALAGMRPPVFFAKAATPALVIGRPQSLWALAGAPGAGAYSAALNGVALDGGTTQIPGQLNRANPTTGAAYLARLTGRATQPGVLLLCDRLWHNGGYTITTTGAQATTFPGLPARDNNGSINGEGVMIGLEVSANAGAAAPAPTISYTNEAGTAGRTAGLAFPTANSPLAGSFFPFGLQAGDKGVKSVQSLSLNTSWVSGTVNLVAYRVLAALPITQANVDNEIDALTSGFPRIYDGTVPFFLFVPTAITVANIAGTYVETQG